MINIRTASNTQSDMDWLHRIPKTELHLHLEGAIPLDTLWESIIKYGGDKSVPDRASLKSRLTYSNFPAFIDAWVWKNNFIRTYDDFLFIGEAIAKDLARQNIIYAEVFFPHLASQRIPQ